MSSSAYRSAVMASASARSLLSRPNALLGRTHLSPKPIPTSSFSSSATPLPRAVPSVVAVLGSVDSMMPLHSAIASARLRSSIAVDSTYWSWLSQGLAIPL